MNNFRRQQFRGLIVTVLTASLLVCAMGFFVIGYAASEGAKQQLGAIDSRYTTIAVMKEQHTQEMREDSFEHVFYVPEELEGESYEQGVEWMEQNYTRMEDGSIQWNDGQRYYSSAALEQVAVQAPQTRAVYHSAILSAHVDGVYGLSSGSLKESHYNLAFDQYSYNFSVLTATCYTMDATDWEEKLGYKPPINSNFFVDVNGETVSLLVQEDGFWFEESVSMHPSYAKSYERGIVSLNIPRQFQLAEHAQGFLADPYQENFNLDHTYIFRGFLTDYPVLQIRVKDPEDGSYYYAARRYYIGALDGDAEQHYWYRDGTNMFLNLTTRDLYSLDGLRVQSGVGLENFTMDLKRMPGTLMPVFYYTLPKYDLPYYAEITGTVEEFLESEEGAVWRDVIIPMAEMNQQSVNVLLVDDLYHLQAFNANKAEVINGREITPLEFDRGEKVCLLSAAYAAHTGMNVGDTIKLDFHDTGYFLTDGVVEQYVAEDYRMVMTHYPLTEENRIGVEQEYTVVGLYSSPEWEFGNTQFRADTIFVPKNSVPDAEQYEDHSMPLLNTVVLLNGASEEFEAYMTEQGFGGYYEYFDQDYSQTIAGLEALELNARRLVLIGLVVVAVTAILFYYLNFRRMVPVARTMRKLGQPRLKIWWQIQWVTLPVILLTVIGGAYLGVHFFDYVTQELLKEEIFLNPETVRRFAVAASALLCVPPVIIAVPISMPNLMKRK